MATPRLMEPMYGVSVIGDGGAIAATYECLGRRRGHILTEAPVAGTPLQRATGLIPVIDSFGFETELRIQAKGKLDVSLSFERWNVVPGDPLDRDVILRPLQPAPPLALARDFVLKTRKRKGLSEDVSVAKFLEREFYEDLLADGTLEA
ncbi:elongation factor G III-V domain-containing protein [Zalerion maritima]|uniref:Elongation factor G III-V domain-containing protein n=1 Tax=Zalerion maritima TaxID=339359 RepID=A0AAD5WML3_9PEZI|nr:elongation factor G III-V domain-containing protein [Zalerion maritima]